ncbi:MAG: PQQ-binding-like beta-propeller repeat protein, partial [Nitrospira sp.]|nr:PQQ-binding-like beta-propeller repeat protein [Nitrospira sp.]
MKTYRYLRVWMISLVMALIWVLQSILLPITSEGASLMWPMQGHDAQHTSRSSTPGPITPTLKWTYDLGMRLQDNASPVVGPDGTIYIPSENDFFAINSNGTLKWKKTYALGNSWQMRNAPALSPDGTVVYVLSSWIDTYVTALSTQNGNVLWQFPVIGGVSGTEVSYSSFTVGSDGTIYIGTWKPAMYAINPNGTLKWRYDSPSTCAIEAPPAIDSNGNVYFVHDCIGLVALGPNGNLRWTDNRV